MPKRNGSDSICKSLFPLAGIKTSVSLAWDWYSCATGGATGFSGGGAKTCCDHAGIINKPISKDRANAGRNLANETADRMIDLIFTSQNG